MPGSIGDLGRTHVGERIVLDKLVFDSTTFGPQFTNFFLDAIDIPVEADLPGDSDDDGDVDLFDAAAFNDCVTGPGGGADPPCDTFDFDDDNDGDLVDYGAFQIALTGSWLVRRVADLPA